METRLLATVRSLRWPRIWQWRANDCGPLCLYLVLRHHGVQVSFRQVLSATGWHRHGTSLLGLSEGAQQLGFTTLCAQVVDFDSLLIEPLPCIAHVTDYHFVVVRSIGSCSIKLTDPEIGFLEITRTSFLSRWKGIVMLLWPTLSENVFTPHRENDLRSRAVHI